MSIQIGIFGYGNLARGVECALSACSDMELAAIFTRRNPASITPLTTGVPVYEAAHVQTFAGIIDVMILCGGSAHDLPTQSPALANRFHLVDSFDTHAEIPRHFTAVDAAAKTGGKLALISVGWDPGLFSLNRLYGEAILPQGQNYTFWGAGVSQGHSDAIRRVGGVRDGKQYTIPVESALQAVRGGTAPVLTSREKHKRECYVVAEDGADTDAIAREIKEMPNYFSDYDTTVHFISAEELVREHSEMPHGGAVIHSGKTGWQSEHTNVIEYNLKLDSNPEFTASVLVAYARAAWRMAAEGQTGCKTVLDVPPAYLSPETGAALRAKLL